MGTGRAKKRNGFVLIFRKIDIPVGRSITGHGTKIILRMKGHLMCEVDDRDAKLACRRGIIALQMHPGPPMKVQFKNLRIKVFK